MKINYEQELLKILNKNPAGIIITDIAKITGFSRNTISKYITILELKKKVKTKKIGQYCLYFSSERYFLPKDIIQNFYKDLISQLKNNFPNLEKKFKKIGERLADYAPLKMKYLEDYIKKINSIDPISKRKVLELIAEMYPILNIFKDSSEIIMKEIEAGQFLVCKFQNSDFMTNFNDFLYHFYIQLGYIERVLNREIKIQILLNIEEIRLDKEHNCYILKISI